MKGLRTFIGAYEVLSSVLMGCSDFIDSLKCSIAGMQSQDVLKWDEDLTSKSCLVTSLLSCFALRMPSG